MAILSVFSLFLTLVQFTISGARLWGESVGERGHVFGPGPDSAGGSTWPRRSLSLRRAAGFGRRVGDRSTLVWNKQESRRKYWTTRSSVRSHRSLVRLLRTARFARALRCAHSWESEFLMSQIDLNLSHSAIPSTVVSRMRHASLITTATAILASRFPLPQLLPLPLPPSRGCGW